MKKNWKEIKNDIQHHESDMDLNYEWLRLEQKLEKNKRKRALLLLFPIGVLSLILLYYFIKPYTLGTTIQRNYANSIDFNGKPSNQSGVIAIDNSNNINKIIEVGENKTEDIKLNNNKKCLEKNMSSISHNENVNTIHGSTTNILNKEMTTLSFEESIEKDGHSPILYTPSNSTFEKLPKDQNYDLLTMDFIDQLVLRSLEKERQIDIPIQINLTAPSKPIKVIKQNNVWITGLFNIGVTMPSYRNTQAENIQALSLRKKYIQPLENLNTSIHINHHLYKGFFIGIGFQYNKHNEKLDYARLDTSLLNIPNQVLESYTTHEGVTTVLTGQSQAYTIFKTRAIRFNEIHNYLANITLGKEFKWVHHSFIIQGGLSIPMVNDIDGYTFNDEHQLTPLQNIITSNNALRKSLGLHYQSLLISQLQLLIGLQYNEYNLKTNQGFDITHRNYSTSIGLKYNIKK